MTSQIRSRVEYLMPTYDILPPLLHSNMLLMPVLMRCIDYSVAAYFRTALSKTRIKRYIIRRPGASDA